MSGQLKFIDATVCIFNELTRLLSMYVCVHMSIFVCICICIHVCMCIYSEQRQRHEIVLNGASKRRRAQLLPGGSTHTLTHTHTRSGWTGLCFCCLHIRSIIVVKYQKDRVVAEKGRAHHLQRSHRSFVYRAQLFRVYRRLYCRLYIVFFSYRSLLFVCGLFVLSPSSFLLPRNYLCPSAPLA